MGGLMGVRSILLLSGFQISSVPTASVNTKFAFLLSDKGRAIENTLFLAIILSKTLPLARWN